MKLSIALMNRKAGTAKTTSAVWLASAMAERFPVLLVDADPAGSALEWADLAADEEALPFRVVGLPSRQLHQRVPDIAKPDEIVVIDTPQTEDHEAIAGSAMRLVDEVIITCAPTRIEVNRTTPVREQIEKTEAARIVPARVSVLLNRAVTGANSVGDTRAVLTGLGYDVLATAIKRTEVYAQSFSERPSQSAAGPWRDVVSELLVRADLGTEEDRTIVARLQAAQAAALR